MSSVPGLLSSRFLIWSCAPGRRPARRRLRRSPSARRSWPSARPPRARWGLIGGIEGVLAALDGALGRLRRLPIMWPGSRLAMSAARLTAGNPGESCPPRRAADRRSQAAGRAPPIHRAGLTHARTRCRRSCFSRSRPSASSSTAVASWSSAILSIKICASRVSETSRSRAQVRRYVALLGFGAQKHRDVHLLAVHVVAVIIGPPLPVAASSAGAHLPGVRSRALSACFT